MTRTTRLLAVGATCALTLTACGSGPSRGNAAAVVGDSRISLSSVSDELTRVLADPQAATVASNPATFQTTLLNILVQGKVLDQAAAATGVTVTAADLDQARAALTTQVGSADLAGAARQQGISPDVLDSLVRAGAERQAIGTALTKDVRISDADLQAAYQTGIDDYETADLRIIVLNSVAAAQALVPQATALDDAAFGALASAQSVDDSTKAVGGLVNGLKRSQLTTAGGAALADAAFAQPLGSTFAVAASTSDTAAFVVRVVSRTTVTLSQATPQLRATLLATQATAAIAKATAAVRVRINPRFGSWNRTTGEVESRDGRSSTSFVSGSHPSPAPSPALLGS